MMTRVGDDPTSLLKSLTALKLPSFIRLKIGSRMAVIGDGPERQLQGAETGIAVIPMFCANGGCRPIVLKKSVREIFVRLMPQIESASPLI